MATIIAMCVHVSDDGGSVVYILYFSSHWSHLNFCTANLALTIAPSRTQLNRVSSIVGCCIFTIWGTWLSTVQWTFLLSMIDSEPKQYTNHYEAAAWQGLKLEKLKIQRGSSSSSFFANVIHGSYSQTTHLFLEHNFTYLVIKGL